MVLTFEAEKWETVPANALVLLARIVVPDLDQHDRIHEQFLLLAVRIFRVG